MKLEKQKLDVKSQPLRQYLADNIIPILTQGLIEISNEMPKNPVEYLANYLEEHQDDLEQEEEKGHPFLQEQENS